MRLDRARYSKTGSWYSREQAWKHTSVRQALGTYEDTIWKRYGGGKETENVSARALRGVQVGP